MTNSFFTPWFLSHRKILDKRSQLKTTQFFLYLRTKNPHPLNIKKNTFNKSSVYLLLFTLTCFFTLFAIKYGNIYINISLRILRFSFLLLYYISLAKKTNTMFVGVLVSFLATSILLAYNSSSVYAMLMVCITRLLFIRMLVSDIGSKRINLKSLKFLLFIFVIIGIVIMSLYYSNSAFFYISILATLLLIISLALSFLNILNTKKRGNLEFFVAIALFVISDMIFGVKRIIGVSAWFLIMASILYNVAYFLIAKSVLKREV